MGTDKSVYLLIGEEEFLKEEWLRNTRQKFFPPKADPPHLITKMAEKEKSFSSNPDFNLFFADDDIDIPNILSIARTRPFLGAKRVIVIKGMLSLKSESDRGRLLSYLKAPSPDTVLILEAEAKEKNYVQNEFLSKIGKLSQVIAFKRLYDAGLYNWISKRAGLRKKKIEPAACELLRQLKGNNLKSLDEELEKLSLYAGARLLITQGDVRQLVGKDIVGNIYDIVDAISRNDKAQVLNLGIDFQKRDLGAAVGLFCWNLRMLLRAKTGGAGLDGLQRFQLERVMGQSRRLNVRWLRTALSELAEFDLRLKTSAFSDISCGWQMLLVRLLEALP